MLIKGTDKNDILEGTDKNDTLKGNTGNDVIFGNDGDDLINGGAGIDILFGGAEGENGGVQGEAFLTTGGSDTLTGGKDADFYFISLENAGGSVIKEESVNDDAVLIVAENTNVDAIVDAGSATTDEEILSIYNDPDTWGNSTIELSRPEKGIVGLEKSGTSLIIDINRDGVAEASDDLTITNYFDAQGDLGKGAPALINNITDQQDIVDFFA
jgi:Ca2+-binding RTX toxin-like protein